MPWFLPQKYSTCSYQYDRPACEPCFFVERLDDGLLCCRFMLVEGWCSWCASGTPGDTKSGTAHGAISKSSVRSRFTLMLRVRFGRTLVLSSLVPRNGTMFFRRRRPNSITPQTTESSGECRWPGCSLVHSLSYAHDSRSLCLTVYLCSRMAYTDYVQQYSRVDICNLTPDLPSSDHVGQWALQQFEGTWKSGSTAGGSSRNTGILHMPVWLHYLHVV